MFKIEFETNNAEFDESFLGSAVALILEKLAEFIVEVDMSSTNGLIEHGGIVKDINGNTVGNWVLSHKTDSFVGGKPVDKLSGSIVKLFKSEARFILEENNDRNQNPCQRLPIHRPVCVD